MQGRKEILLVREIQNSVKEWRKIPRVEPIAKVNL